MNLMFAFLKKSWLALSLKIIPNQHIYLYIYRDQRKTGIWFCDCEGGESVHLLYEVGVVLWQKCHEWVDSEHDLLTIQHHWFQQFLHSLEFQRIFDVSKKKQ
jgi:hypothetical protein